MTSFLEALSKLSPRQFENLAFDLLRASGVTNLVWRTPGPDGGRDIEGTFPTRDLSGHIERQKWYVECKRYAASIDWPTIWEKIAYADNEQADFLLVITNSNPSPACESEITKWNSRRRRVHVRIWRGYELDSIVGQFPSIALKYGLQDPNSPWESGFQNLAAELAKIAQASYVSNALGEDIGKGLELSAAIAELLSLRLTDLKQYGRIIESKSTLDGRLFDWMGEISEAVEYEEVSIRLVASALLYFTAAKSIAVEVIENELVLTPVAPRIELTDAGYDALNQFFLWTPYEVSRGGADLLVFRVQRRAQ